MEIRYLLHRWGGWIVISILLICVIYLGYQYSQQSSEIRIATAGRGGYYYKFGTILKNHIEKHTNYRVILQETKGSMDNRSRLLSRKSDLAILQPAAVSMQNLSAVAPLWDDYFQIIVREDANIKDLKDLQGHYVSIGEKGSGTRNISLRLLEHYGIDPESLLNNDASLSDLLNNKAMVAAFESTSLINPSVKKVMNTGEFDLLEINHALGLAFHYPYMSGNNHIPPGVYSAMQIPAPGKPLSTLSSTAILAAHKNAPYDIIKAVLPMLYTIELRNESPVLVDKTRTQNCNSWSLLPVHPAARSFFNPYEGAQRISVFIETISRAEVVIPLILIIILMCFSFYKFSKHHKVKEQRQLEQETQILETFIAQMSKIEWGIKEAKDMRLLKQYLDEIMEIRKQVLETEAGSRIQHSTLYLVFMQESMFLIQEVEWKLSMGSNTIVKTKSY